MSNSISLEDAKALMSAESINKLKEMVYAKPQVDLKLKANCDILMSALCTATTNGVIRYNSLDETIIKILNASTSTLSEKKLVYALRQIHDSQPHIKCIITLKSGGLHTDIVNEWVIDGSDEGVKLIDIFDYVVNKFEITPQLVRQKMGEMLKTTIVNNIAQLVSKYNTSSDEEKKSMQVSITTISRLVNMSGYTLYAEFKEVRP